MTCVGEMPGRSHPELGKGHVGQVGSADLLQAVGGCSPDPGLDCPVPGKGNVFTDVSRLWMDTAQKETVFTVHQLPGAVSGLLSRFTSAACLFFLLCSLCKEKGEAQLCSL